MEWTYCWIKDKEMLGRYKRFMNTEVFINGEWKRDKNIISDRIMGYDENEPVDSSYKFGNIDIMSRLEVITEEEAFNIINKM